MLAWDPILRGRVVITDLGEQKIAEEQAQKRAARAAIHLDRPGTLRIKDVGDRRVITLTGEHEERP
jgi:hypothetical protein